MKIQLGSRKEQHVEYKKSKNDVGFIYEISCQKENIYFK